MGCWGYMRFAGKPANNLLKRFGCATVELYVKCCQNVRRKLAPQYACPCDLLVTSMTENNSRKESEIPTPPLLPAPRQPSQSSTSSSLSSLRSSTGDFREWDKRKYPSTSVTRTTPLSDAEVQPWFFNISRQDAEIYLHDCADGTFLMRPSTKGGSDSVATLNVQFNGKVFHVLVQKRNGGKFGLGTSKEGEETFASIVELVEYYQRKRLQLFSNGNLAGTTSLRSCYQSPW